MRGFVMRRYSILYVDAALNLILGTILVFFRPAMIRLLGIPHAKNGFYPNILGAVLIGIGVALLLECFRTAYGLIGLGLGGAVAINLCGGTALAAWLLFGNLDIPFRGSLILWILVIMLICISGLELRIHLKKGAAG